MKKLPVEIPKAALAARSKPALWGLAVSLCAMAAAFCALPERVGAPFSPPQKSRAFLEISPEGEDAQMLGADINDYSPMFLPTRWNYSPDSLRAAAGEDLEPPVLARSEAAPANPDYADLFKPAAEEGGELEGMAVRAASRSFFAGFGRSEMPAEEGGEDVYVNISRIGGGFEKTLKYPAAKLAAARPAAPLVFMMQVDFTGGAPMPMLLERSGNEDVDDALAKLISSGGALGPLPQGYYRISVSP